MFSSFYCALLYCGVLNLMRLWLMTKILPAPDQYLWLLITHFPNPDHSFMHRGGVGPKSQHPMLPHPAFCEFRQSQRFLSVFIHCVIFGCYCYFLRHDCIL